MAKVCNRYRKFPVISETVKTMDDSNQIRMVKNFPDWILFNLRISGFFYVWNAIYCRRRRFIDDNLQPIIHRYFSSYFSQ